MPVQLSRRPRVLEPPPSDSMRIVPERKPGQWILAAAAMVVVAMVVNGALTNERFQWGVVFDYFLSDRILSGLLNTLNLTLVSMAIGIVGGLVLALMRLSGNPVLASISSSYIWLFRGTPLFVQLLFWGSISALYPRLSIGVPFGPEFASFSANELISPYTAAILGLGLNEAAYMAEIMRSGISSVDRGQTEAAYALGMGRATTTWRIVLPQAMRVIIPPTGNQLIGMLKTSAMVAVLAYPELLYSAQLIYAVNYQTIPLLITASLWYLLVTTVLSIGQHFLERHYQRSDGVRPARDKEQR